MSTKSENQMRIVVLGGGALNKMVFEHYSSKGPVLCLDGSEDAPCFEWVKDYFVCDITNPKEVLERVVAFRGDVVIAINERGVHSAAYANQVIGLSGQGKLMAEVTTNKILMRQFFELFGVAQPGYQLLSSGDKPPPLKFPVIAKDPLGGGAARGISLVQNFEQLCSHVSKVNQGKPLLIEEQIKGQEFSVETLIVNGRCTHLAVGLRIPTPSNSCVAERIIFSAGDREIHGKVFELIETCAKALGMWRGVLHSEVFQKKNGTCYLVELASRPGGGHIFHPIVNLVSGLNYPCIYAKALSGKLDIKDCEIIDGGVVIYDFIIPPRTGVIEKICLPPADRKGVIHAGVFKTMPFEFQGINNGTDRCGFILSQSCGSGPATEQADRLRSEVEFHYIE